MEGKGEKERYTHLNAKFQRITKRAKKAFFSDPLQCEVKRTLGSITMNKASGGD